MVAPAKRATAADRAEPDSEVFASSLHTEIDEALALDPPDSEQLDEQARALKEHPLDQPFELRRQDIDEQASAKRSARRGADSEPESEPELQDLSFVRQARRKAFWRQPRARGMLTLVLLALGMLLMLQVALHERDQLAARHPGLRPMLLSVCAAMSCEVGPPRQIDAVAIDSSSFNKLRGDTYRLSVTLKNQAKIPVAMPALELTLTDPQEQALVRRVITSAELGPHTGAIAAGAEWSGSLALAVAVSDNGERVAGYRLLAFYP